MFLPLCSPFNSPRPSHSLNTSENPEKPKIWLQCLCCMNNILHKEKDVLRRAINWVLSQSDSSPLHVIGADQTAGHRTVKLSIIMKQSKGFQTATCQTDTTDQMWKETQQNQNSTVLLLLNLTANNDLMITLLQRQKHFSLTFSSVFSTDKCCNSKSESSTTETFPRIQEPF